MFEGDGNAGNLRSAGDGAGRWLAIEAKQATHRSAGSLASAEQYARTITKELGSSGPYAMLFCLDDLDKKKHRDIINSLKNSFFKNISCEV